MTDTPDHDGQQEQDLRDGYKILLARFRAEGEQSDGEGSA
jgi:hypothetical protein